MLSSFLIAFHSFRIDNLLQTIRLLEINHPEVVSGSELILLCQDRIGSIPSKFASTQTVSLNLPNMQKCKAINHGARMAKSDKLIMLDSDRVLPKGYFMNVLTTMNRKDVVSTKITHKIKSVRSDKELIERYFSFDIEPRKLTNIFSGNSTLYTDDYWAAGGMNEEYIGYGWEDDDMSMRLLRNNAKFVFRDEIELHLYHHRDSYGTGDQKMMYLKNGIKFHTEWCQPMTKHLQDEINEYTKDLL